MGASVDTKNLVLANALLKEVEVNTDLLTERSLLVLTHLWEADGGLPLGQLLEMQKLRHRGHFRAKHVNNLLELGLIAMSDPTKPTVPDQHYKLTSKGRVYMQIK